MSDNKQTVGSVVFSPPATAIAGIAATGIVRTWIDEGELTVNLQVARIPSEIVFVTGDDWVALYIDGVKAIEGHSLHWSHVLDALGVKYEQQEAPEIEDGRTGDVVYGETLGDVAVHYYGEGE